MLKFKKMGGDRVPVLLVTANVGSIFEDPAVMLPIWTSEFLQFVSKMEPKFIGLHLQEVGGKTYEKSMQYVQDFVRRLCSSSELRLFDKIRIFLDEDFSCPEKFTALGNMYFVHSSLTEVSIWDWQARGWMAAEGRETHGGNIEKVTTKEKAKFPQNLFPECKWSRKGFLRTRWQIRGTSVDFINIHLFHDASNVAALEPFPSVYARSRRRALKHTLRHLHDDTETAPYFIFGDFNFRMDTGAVVKKLTEDLSACRLQNGAECETTKLQYRSTVDNRPVLTVGKKEFNHTDHQKVFREPWLLKYDRELEALRPHLYEYPIKFPPSYPFEEDVHQPTHYMKTRCPAWCDRVLLSQTARLLIQHQDPLRAGENKHLHASRKSVADSTDSSGRASSSDSSPARSSSPHNTQGQGDGKRDKICASDMDGLHVPGIGVSRKSIADPTSLQHAINARVAESDGSPNRRRLVRNQSEGSPKPGFGNADQLRRLVEAPGVRRRVEYGAVGETTCMGDHKPIYLRVMLQSERGTLPCGALEPPCPLCLPFSTLPPVRPRLTTDPGLHAGLFKSKPPAKRAGSHPDIDLKCRLKIKRSRTGSLDDCSLKIPDVEITSAEYTSYDGIFVNDIDKALLYSANDHLDPYTPESVDSHSPNPENGDDLSSEVAESLMQCCLDERLKLKRDRSVSPTQLKSRLDRLLTSEKSAVKSIPELVRLGSRDSEKMNDVREGGCFAGYCRRGVCGDCGMCEACCGRTGCNQCCRGGIGDCCTS